MLQILQKISYKTNHFYPEGKYLWRIARFLGRMVESLCDRVAQLYGWPVSPIASNMVNFRGLLPNDFEYSYFFHNFA